VLTFRAGLWNNSVVAVKVIEYPADETGSGSPLEGLLSEKVQHPNVVGDSLPPGPIL